MDDEQDPRPDGLARAPGAWLWLMGVALTAAAFYWAIPAGHGRPSSVTIVGFNAPDEGTAGYPGLRLRPQAQSQLAAADVAR